jgi:MFS transporter, AAHS family, 4-hydroxybenzoate transporter
MAMANRAGTAASPAGGTALRVAILCTLVLTLDGYDISSIGLAVPSLIKAWNLPAASFTQAFALSSIGIMVGAMSAGPLADRFGRKPMLLLSVALFGAFSLASAYADSLVMLVALRFFTGVGIGGAMPTTVALTSDYVSDRWRAPAVTLMFTGAPIGGFFAGQIAAQILPHWGWQGIFMVGGIVPLALLVVMFFVLPESPQYRGGLRPELAKANPVAGLFKDGLAVTTLFLWAIFLLNLLNMYLIIYWLPTVLNLGGLTPADAAFASSFYQGGAIISALLLAPIIARFGPEKVLAINLLFGTACIGLVAVGHLSYVWVMVVLFGAGWGFVGSQTALNGFAAALYPAHVRSTGVGWALGVGRLGGIFGPIVGGGLLAFGLPANEVMLFACVPGVITAVMVTVLGLHRHSPPV